MSKHTPGPWGKIYANVRDAAGRCVADCGSRTDADAQANARLIAAAPDMLKILKWIDSRLDIEAAEKGEQGIFPCSAWRPDIKEAIAKAEKG